MPGTFHIADVAWIGLPRLCFGMNFAGGFYEGSKTKERNVLVNGKNDFAQVFKHLATDLEIILLSDTSRHIENCILS